MYGVVEQVGVIIGTGAPYVAIGYWDRRVDYNQGLPVLGRVDAQFPNLSSTEEVYVTQGSGPNVEHQRAADGVWEKWIVDPDDPAFDLSSPQWQGGYWVTEFVPTDFTRELILTGRAWWRTFVNAGGTIAADNRGSFEWSTDPADDSRSVLPLLTPLQGEGFTFT